MAHILVMPKLGLTMNEGTIIKWHKEEGDIVKIGDNLYDIETDKITNTITAKEEGILRKIIVGEKKSGKVTAPIGILAEKDEDIISILEGMGENQIEAPIDKSINVKPCEATGKDIIVIGGGPGGYVAAIRAAQLGANVKVVEKKHLGGTCLNIGCVPTKVLLHTAELFKEILNCQAYGIKLDGKVSVDWDILQNRKEEVVAHLVGGVEGLLRLNNIEVVNGEASFIDKNTINVRKDDGSSINLKADNYIIATGSKPFIPQIEGIESEGVLDSTEILSLEEIPKELIIVGGGVIGTEFASLFNSLGSKVTIIEMLPYILPPIDREISEIVKMKFENEGINIYTSAQVIAIESEENKLHVIAKTEEGEVRLSGDKVLVSVGRKALMEGLNLNSIGIGTSKKGIEIDNKMQTNVKDIYAIGDVTGINMLAHVASEQGIVAAENIMGLDRKLDYDIVPACVYSKPEIASIGLTEEETKKKGIDYKSGLFALSNNSKAIIMNEFEGTLIKIISDKKYDEVLGIHIYGPRATDLISEGALALRLESTLDEIITTIHPHPTVGEGIKEAALAVNNSAIHAAP